ncbi:hypothetical protein SODALDRAFT_333951 [Sodiomyces alkalinus F11]|uniref:Nudix hydrolase domain-containing protein n=1 Tax=Sodiomyces alkalinus (strain CBS 110278 / VKM F-3762 / F11) TaxID=1314773 RepID=A0A3N2PUL2_SODAK|nr:hypothetical protein SODALDRAFT_333951 [Sodiomyces alkalinus F11]ROT38182.1 hypothetical protein SODALDRAFT_333951 [Sodiomyces alkalinus F11]
MTPALPSAPPRGPAFKIAYHPSLERFNLPPQSYLADHAPAIPPEITRFHGLATSALVFDSRGRVLLLRRAQHDSMPGLWEPPGGAADLGTDKSVLEACARELWEEAGLVARRAVRVMSIARDVPPGTVFWNRTRERCYVRVVLELEVEEVGRQQDGEVPVKMDADEHDAFVWASEDEVRSGHVPGVQGPFELTFGGTREALLEAFRMRRDET